MLGKFITFEGGEGTGKSTQTQLFADYLENQNIPIIITREPGGTEGAELIRALIVSGSTGRWLPSSEILLLSAARVEHFYKVILPALEEGKWVICDRFTDSTIAYQGYGHGIDLKFIKSLQQLLFSNYQPHLTFIFDLDPVIGIKRSLLGHEGQQNYTSETRFENMEMEFHHRVRQGYKNIAEKEPKRCRIIDASGSVNKVKDTIIQLTSEWITSISS